MTRTVERFAYVCADPGIPLPGTKGAAIHVASLCRALRHLGLRGDVYTIRPEGESVSQCELHEIPLPPRKKRKSVEERESRLFLASAPDKIDPEGRADLVYERYTLWHTGGLARARELNIPFVLEVNSPLPEEAQRFRHLANFHLAEGIAQLLLREADGIVAVSDEVAEWVRQRRGHAKGIWVVPNGVDPEVFAPRRGRRPSPLPPKGVPLVGFSGSFRPWHGLEELFEGFRLLTEKMTDAHLVCVGDGPERHKFEDRVVSAGIEDRVVMSGRLDHEAVPDWVGHADVAVAPYPDMEHFYFSPLKIFEFLCLGLPVVSTRSGQVPSIIPHGERGLLCAPGSAQDLADAIEHLLRSPDEARRLADAGRQWVLENATWANRAREIVENVERLP